MLKNCNSLQNFFVNKDMANEIIVTVKQPSYWFDPMSKPDCTHEKRSDLTQGRGEVRNYYCPTCRMHIYKGRTWSAKEWSEYVEDFSEDKSKYFTTSVMKSHSIS